MHQPGTILAIIGSASPNSSNLLLAKRLQRLGGNREFIIWSDLAILPHFDPEQSMENPPEVVRQLRAAVAKADGVLISTPEYIFSIPARLKNMLEWCVATTVFEQKPLGIITASANGAKGHAELQLIMKTLGARFTEATCLLIQGIKGKINEDGTVKDATLDAALQKFAQAFQNRITRVSDAL